MADFVECWQETTSTAPNDEAPIRCRKVMALICASGSIVSHNDGVIVRWDILRRELQLEQPEQPQTDIQASLPYGDDINI